MAEENKPVSQPAKPTTPVATTPDWKAAENNLVKVHKFLASFEGKPGYNPFIYNQKFVKPFADRYNKGERSSELHKSLMELKEIPPSVDLLGVEIKNIIPQVPIPKPTT